MCEFCEKESKYEWAYGKCGIRRNTPRGTVLAISDISYCPPYKECSNKNFPVTLEMPIVFCPLCGRKLSEETEKPSVDEILATLREKLTQYEYLKLKESAEMFADGINGLWEVLRKGIENVF